MSKKRSSMLNLLKDTFREWREDGANRLEATSAYYTAFLLEPPKEGKLKPDRQVRIIKKPASKPVQKKDKRLFR